MGRIDLITIHIYSVPRSNNYLHVQLLQLLGPNELKRLHPYLSTEDLAGAAWVPGDATCNPQAICGTLASLASKGGNTCANP